MLVKELCKMAPYVRNKGRLYLSLVEVKATVNRQQQLFTKNTGPCEHASGSIRSDACPVPVSQGSRLSREKLTTKAPVNGGSNLESPKVAKFLVGQVPTCMKGVMTVALSQPATR